MGTCNRIHASGAGGGSGALDDACNSQKSIRGGDGHLFEIQGRNELNLPVGPWMMKLLTGQSFPRNQRGLYVLGLRSVKPQPFV